MCSNIEMVGNQLSKQNFVILGLFSTCFLFLNTMSSFKKFRIYCLLFCFPIRRFFFESLAKFRMNLGTKSVDFCFVFVVVGFFVCEVVCVEASRNNFGILLEFSLVDFWGDLRF